MRFRPIALLVVIAAAACGDNSGNPASSGDGGSGGPDGSSGPDGTTDSSSGGDSGGGGDAPIRDSASDSSHPVSDGAPFTNTDVCGAASGTVAWMGSIAAQASPLNLAG